MKIIVKSSIVSLVSCNPAFPMNIIIIFLTGKFSGARFLSVSFVGSLSHQSQNVGVSTGFHSLFQ